MNTCVIEATTFRLAKSRSSIAEVVLEHAGLRFRCLVREGRIVWPQLRGAPAVYTEDAVVRESINRLATQAAARAIGEGGREPLLPMERAA